MGLFGCEPFSQPSAYALSLGELAEEFEGCRAVELASGSLILVWLEVATQFKSPKIGIFQALFRQEAVRKAYPVTAFVVGLISAFKLEKKLFG